MFPKVGTMSYNWSTIDQATVDPVLGRPKHSQAKFGIENLVNFVLQWYKVELLIVDTMVQG